MTTVKEETTGGATAPGESGSVETIRGGAASPESISAEAPSTPATNPAFPPSANESAPAPPVPDASKKRSQHWRWAIAALCGVALVSAAAVAIYAIVFGGDHDWEACKDPAKRTVEERIKTCGAVILAGSKPAQAMAFAYRTRARAFFDVGEIASAVEDYSKALATITNDPALYSERGFAQLRNGQPTQAIEDFTAATALDASLVEPLVGRGNAYLAISQPDMAAQDFSLALTLKPDMYEAVYRRALANVRMNRIADAAADYDRALELAPKYPNYWNARCWFRATMSIDLDLALADCDEALKLKPGFAPALDSRAFVLLRLGRLEDARDAYDKTIAAEARYAWPYFGRGIVRKRLGDEAGAQADFDKAVSLQPDIATQYANYGEQP